MFQNYLPFNEGVVLHLDKPESPSPNNAMFGLNWPSGFGEEDENVRQR